MILKHFITSFIGLLALVFEPICNNKLILLVENPRGDPLFIPLFFMRSLNDADLLILSDKKNSISASLGNSMIV